jgi:hypothetical protein
MGGRLAIARTAAAAANFVQKCISLSLLIQIIILGRT